MNSVYIAPDQISTLQQAKDIVEPLAQSFIVNTPGGVFITSIDLFFAEKDPNLPVTVEIRTMENGVPSGVIFPFSTVTVQSANVATSDNGVTPTRFTFSGPIYLLDTAEYCFTVTANSRSYKIWMAEMGGNDTVTPAYTIPKQPYSGVMFRSQNSSVWIPDQTKDLKFNLYRAAFNTTGSLILNEKPVPAVLLDSNPIETYTTSITPTNFIGAGTTTVTCTVGSTTGLAVNDRITISGAVGTEQSKLNGSWTIASVPNGTTFTFVVSSSVANGTYTTGLGLTVKGSKAVRIYHKDHGNFAGVSQVTLVQNMASPPATYNGIPSADLFTTHNVILAEADSYTISVATASTAAGRTGGSLVFATENRVFDTLYPNIQYISLKDTGVTWSTRMTSGKSLAGSETPYILGSYVQIPVNTNVPMTEPKVVRAVNTANPTAKSFYLKADFTTSNPNLSPVIDLNRTSLITINNRLDNPSASAATGYNVVQNYQAETVATGSSALSKYITKRIDLANPASALRIYLLANQPPSSAINFYYKVLPKGSDANFDSIEWTAYSPVDAIPYSSDLANYTEIEYDITETALSSKQFTAFAIKLVFTSQNSSSVPSVKEFRAIAVT